MQHARDIKPAERKHGAKPKKAVTLSPRAVIASWLSVEITELLRARLLLAAQGEVSLAAQELVHLARDWQPKRKGKRGRWPTAAALKRGESRVVARFFIWTAYEGKKPGDDSEVKRAKGKTADKFECSKRTVETHIAVAKEFDNGEWWPKACRLARKKKHDALMRF